MTGTNKREKSMRRVLGIIVTLCVVTSVSPQHVNKYYDEIEAALENTNTTLAKVSTLGSGQALAVLRVAQWRNYLIRTQQRRPGFRDRVGYFFMENEIKSVADRCYVLMPEETPLLYATVESYAKILRIPTPLILFVDDRKLFDASAAAWTHRSGFLILSRGLFEETSEEEFCGLVAHEMGYIVERYQAKMAFYFTPVAIAVFVLMIIGAYKLLASSPQLSWWHIFGSSLMVGGYGIFATLYWCFLARRYEQAADRAAALISAENGLAMVTALQRGQTEDFGGDLLIAKQLTNTLVDLTPEERQKTCLYIEKMQIRAKEALATGQYDLGIMGTNQSLASRRNYFQSIIDLGPAADIAS